MVLKLSILVSCPVSSSLKPEWGLLTVHRVKFLPLLLTSASLPFSLTWKKAIQAFKCSVLLRGSIKCWCKGGEEVELSSQMQGKRRNEGKERQRGGRHLVSFWMARSLQTGSTAPEAAILGLFASLQTSPLSSTRCFSFWVQKGLLIILIKGGQWTEKTVRCMRGFRNRSQSWLPLTATTCLKSWNHPCSASDQSFAICSPSYFYFQIIGDKHSRTLSVWHFQINS